VKKSTKRRVSPERASRRNAILAAAVELFAARGRENVTFGDIARKARLSRPLVYFYFPDLETLACEAVILASEKLYRHFLAAIRPADCGLDQIMALGHAYVSFSRREPALFEILAHKESNQPKDQPEHPLDEECERHSAAVMSLLVAVLQKGVRDGSIRRDVGDTGKVAVCLWGLTHGLIQLASNQMPLLEATLGTSFADVPDFGLDLISRSLRAKTRTNS
jgi:AcrR family transcriptional regulator